MTLARYRAPLIGAIALLGASIAPSACAPTVIPAGAPIATPHIDADTVVLDDGIRLPLRRWLPREVMPRAVILALHGFDDYGNAFELPATYWAEHGVRSEERRVGKECRL